MAHERSSHKGLVHFPLAVSLGKFSSAVLDIFGGRLPEGGRLHIGTLVRAGNIGLKNLVALADDVLALQVVPLDRVAVDENALGVVSGVVFYPREVARKLAQCAVFWPRVRTAEEN